MRKPSLFAAAMAALPLLVISANKSFAAQSETSTCVITIFRGKPASPFAGFSSKDAWNRSMHQKISIDGKPVVDMHNQAFASFPVQPGRHIVEFTTYAAGDVSVDVHPGERLFIYPVHVVGMAQWALNLSLKLLPCSEAVLIGKDARPVEGKFLLAPGSLPEVTFPASCPSIP